MARFSYCFIAPEGSDYPPILTRHSIETGESRSIEGKGGPLTLSAFVVQHGNIPALGYRIGDAAYTPDLHDIPRKAGPRSTISNCGSSTGYAMPGIPAISASAMHCPGSSASSRNAPSSPTCIPTSTYEVLRQSLAGRRNPGPMTGCGWCWSGRAEATALSTTCGWQRALRRYRLRRIHLIAQHELLNFSGRRLRDGAGTPPPSAS